MENKKIDDQIFNLKNINERIEFAQKKWEKYICNFASKHKNAVCGYEDFIQEANLIIVKSAKTWDPQKSSASFENYTYTCLHNGLIDASTRSGNAVVVPSGSLKIADVKSSRLTSDIEDIRGNTFEYIDLVDIISSLDFTRREVGKMYFIEKKTIIEIAKKLGESKSSIHRRVNSLKKILRNKLDVYS